MATDADILTQVDASPDLLLPLQLQVVTRERQGGDTRVDGEIAVWWGERSWRFVVETKSSGTPKMVAAAASQARRFADELGLPPMVIVPYLAQKQLQALADEGVSGIDLCGNGTVQVPGELFVFKTGKPNLYPASAPIRNVYQGSSSLVARVFLLKPRFESVSEVAEEIVRRNGSISLSTVSKVLKSLDEDLVIRKEGRASRLLQPDELLDKLAANFERPRPPERKAFQWAFQWAVPDGDRPSLIEVAQSSGVDLVPTGAASVEQYTVMPRESVSRFYCSNVARLAKALGDLLKPASRFADIELLPSNDPVVYFDRRIKAGVPWASPVQCWLELQAGDKREQDAAKQVRRRILDHVEAGGDET